MFKRWGIFLLLLSAAVSAAAQSTRVHGKVVDAQTGEPLPFVGVYFDGTTIGISSDLNGDFSLETRSPEAKVLTAQMIGYLPQSVPVPHGAFSEINFRLVPDPRQLDAAVVKPDDRYIKSILRKLDQSLKENDPDRGPDWSSHIYSKIELDVTNMEDFLSLGGVENTLGFIRNYADTSAITGKAYIPAMISENVSDLYHSNKPEFTREVLRASRISGLPEENIIRSYTGTYFLKTNFYRPSIGVFNLELPNPAAASSHLFYNYFLVDSLQVEGRKTYVLRFHPKKLVTSPTLDGEMQIDAQDFGIRSVHAALSTASNVNWIRHINLDIQNRRTPQGRWFYAEERLFLDLSLTLNDKSKLVSILANRNIHYDPPVYGPITDPDALSSQEDVVDRKTEPRDQLYWDLARPYPLSEREQGIYKMVDEIKQLPVYNWTFGIATAIVQQYIHLEGWKFEFGRWLRTIAHNDTEGLRLQAGGRTTKYFSTFIRLGGYLAYGFKDHQPKWELTTEFNFNRETQRMLTLEYRRDYATLSSGTGVFSAPNIFSSIFARNHGRMQSMIHSFRIGYDHEFSPSVNSYLGFTRSRVWGNEQVPLVRTSDGLWQPTYTTNEVEARLRLSWDERVTRNYFKKRYIYTKYPVITFDAIAGFRGISPEDVSFVKTTANISWRVPAMAIGFGRFYLEGGAIWGSVPYTVLKLHEGNQTFFLDRTAFSCMDYYEFASDRWLTGYYEHNFNGLLLGKIPLIKKLDLREVVTARFAWGTISPENQPGNGPMVFPSITKTLETPYVEVGVGISNILRILRVDCFWRLTHRYPEVKKNFVVNLGVDVDF